jgi:murein DD-endopeptidase
MLSSSSTISNKNIKATVFGLLLLTNVVCAFSQSGEGLLVYYKVNPSIVKIDGQLTLYYELHFKNTSTDSIHLTYISSNDKLVLTAQYDENSIMEAFVNRSKKRSPKPTLASRDSAVVYLETRFSNPPAILDHTIHFDIVGKGSHTIAGPRVKCSTAQAAIIGPPLGKGNWAAVYDPSWLRGHRRVLFQQKGMEKIPGRFAIDFILLNDNGKYSNGDEDVVSNWLGYDADVLAVVDGTIVSVKNDFTESKTLSTHPSYPADKAAGNYISIDIGGGRFVFYEHLKPGSIKVKPGQKVMKGEVIASLGFTGQSTGPHLHFHLADANSPLGAEGIPFVFERFEVLGSYPDFSRFGKDKWTPVEEKNIITNERPGPNTVIRF